MLRLHTRNNNHSHTQLAVGRFSLRRWSFGKSSRYKDLSLGIYCTFFKEAVATEGKHISDVNAANVHGHGDAVLGFGMLPCSIHMWWDFEGMIALLIGFGNSLVHSCTQWIPQLHVCPFLGKHHPAVPLRTTTTASSSAIPCSDTSAQTQFALLSQLPTTI